MAVKARAEITLSSIRDVQSVTRYYLLQSSTSAVPSKPTTNPPGGDWVTSEPTYTSGSTNSLYFVDLTVFSDGTFAYSDVSLSSSYEAAKVAYNKADNAEDIAERATHSLNLTPYGSRSFADTDYWYNGHEHGGYTGSSGVIWNTEQLTDGWIHICVDATGYTGTAKYVSDNAIVRTSPSFKLNTLYTILYEIRNNNSVLAEASANNTQFYIQEATSKVFWGGSVTEILEGSGTGSGFILRTMAPEANTTYHKRFTKMSDSGTHAGSNPPYLFQMQHRYGAGDYVDFELRISIYEGRYLGDYMPYVVSDVTDLSQIGGRNLYIAKDATDGYIDSSTGNISDMQVTNQEQVSDFIPVKAGDNLVFQAWAKVTNTGSNSGSAWMGYAFYDSEKVYLGSRPSKYDGTLRADGFTHNYYNFSVPEGASYIRCSYRRVLEGKAKLERGVVLTDWTQAPEDLESDISAANALAQSAKNTADGKITTFYAASTATPTATTVGDLWIKTDDGNSLWRWNGSSWVSVDNADIQSALTAAGTAQATADSKIVTFAQTSAPTATDVGDIWIDTDDDNRMYRWDGEDWVDVHDPKIAENSDRLDENDAKVNELLSDGANLFIGTTYPDVSSAETLPRIFGQTHATRYRGGNTLSVAEHGFRVTNNASGYTYITFGNSASSGLPLGMNGLIAGETYTISADVTCKQLSKNTNTTTYYLRCLYYDDHTTTGTLAQNTYKNVISITKNDRGVEKSGRCEFTFTIPDNVTMCYLGFWCSRTTSGEFQAGDFIELRNLKLEKGSKATPWSSPVDWNARITSSANGKNTNTYTTKNSAGVITYPADAVAGDQLFVAEYGSTVYTTLYRFNGTSWENTQIGGMAVTQLDAGNVVSGTMSANRIKGDTLTLGGANNVDGMLKVYDANGTLVGSFTREGLMAIAGSIGGWNIGEEDLTGEWDVGTKHWMVGLSKSYGLRFKEVPQGGDPATDWTREVQYNAGLASFSSKENSETYYGAVENYPGENGLRIYPKLIIGNHSASEVTEISTDQIDTTKVRLTELWAHPLGYGDSFYMRQPLMIMADVVTISTGTSEKNLTLCTVPAAYQSGYRIVPFVSRRYGNQTGTPSDSGDFYYAYYNSVTKNVHIKLANPLPSGTIFQFDYMIYAVPES